MPGQALCCYNKNNLLLICGQYQAQPSILQTFDRNMTCLYEYTVIKTIDRESRTKMFRLFISNC